MVSVRGRPASTRLLPVSDMTTTTPISFEIYPLRTDAGLPALYETIRALASVDPRFISVTFGAGGSTRSRSLGVLTRRHPMTCVGSSYAEANALIREFLDAKITRFLALRGDPPEGSSEDDVLLGDLESAAQLVQLIGRVQAERVPYAERPVPGSDAVRVASRTAWRSPSPHSRTGIRAPCAVPMTSMRLPREAGFALRPRSRSRRCSSTPMTTCPSSRGRAPRASPFRSSRASCRSRRRLRLRRVLELTGEPLPSQLAIDLDVEPTPREDATSASHTRPRSPERSSRTAPPALTCTPSTTTTPFSRSSARRASSRNTDPEQGDRTMTATFPTGTILGYPRIGRDRELKRWPRATGARARRGGARAGRRGPPQHDARPADRARPGCLGLLRPGVVLLLRPGPMRLSPSVRCRRASLITGPPTAAFRCRHTSRRRAARVTGHRSR